MSNLNQMAYPWDATYNYNVSDAMCSDTKKKEEKGNDSECADPECMERKLC